MIYKNLTNFSILLFGSIFTQLLLVISMPYFSDIYSKESFGLLALVIAISSSLLPLINDRLGFVLLSESDDSKASEIFHHAILYSILTSSIFILTLTIVSFFINFSSQPSNFLFLLFAFFILSSVYQIILSDLNRSKKYSHLATVKFLKSIALLSGFYIFQYNYDGLVVSHIISFLFIVSIYLVFLRNISLNIFSSFTFDKIFIYKKFVINNALASSLNSLVTNLPIFFVGAVFGAQILGAYQLYNMILVIPLSMIGQSISQINMGNIIELKKENQKILPYFLKVSQLLFFGGILIFIITNLLNSFLFSKFFNIEKWFLTKDIIMYAIFFNIIEFISSALSTTMETLRKITRSTNWKVIMTISSLIIHSFAYFSSFNFINYIILLTIERSLIYIFLYYQTINAVRDYDSESSNKN